MWGKDSMSSCGFQEIKSTNQIAIRNSVRHPWQPEWCEAHLMQTATASVSQTS